MTIVRFACLVALTTLVIAAGCARDGGGELSDQQVRDTTAAAIPDDLLAQARLADGRAPRTLAELDQAKVRVGNRDLPFAPVLEERAEAACEKLAEKPDDALADALRFGPYDALLRIGVLSPDRPGGIPAECLVDDGQRIDPQLYDGDADNASTEARSAFDSWLSESAPSALADRVIRAVADGADKAMRG